MVYVQKQNAFLASESWVGYGIDAAHTRVYPDCDLGIKEKYKVHSLLFSSISIPKQVWEVKVDA